MLRAPKLVGVTTLTALLVIGTVAGADQKLQDKLKESEELLEKLAKAPKDLEGKELILTGFMFHQNGDPHPAAIPGSNLMRVDVSFVGPKSQNLDFWRQEDGVLSVTQLNFAASEALLQKFQAFKKKQNKKAGNPEFEVTVTIKKEGKAWVAEISELKVYSLGPKAIKPEVIKGDAP